jgi:2-dehydro-3-deoxygluconokinase
MPMKIKPKDQCRWDLVSLGEVMLRLDPVNGRIATSRQFQAWEGGGEYNVSRALKRCFGMNTAVVTALADNPIGRLIQDLIFQGGVDQDCIRWVEYDGVGRSVRNGLNFTERGFGVRSAVGCSDRGHTAASQLKKGDIDWERFFSTKAPAGFTPAAFSARFRRPRRKSPPKRCKSPAVQARSCRMTSITAPHSGMPSAEKQNLRK